MSRWGLIPEIAGVEPQLARDLVDNLADRAAQLRDVLEASHDMISLNLLDGTFVSVFPACRHILGYSAEELLGRRASDLVHPEDRAPPRQHASG